MARKDRGLQELIARLELTSRGWLVVDHWDADLHAVGLATTRDPRRLAYVSTFMRTAGRFDYECETPAGPGPEDDSYTTTASGQDVDYDTLLRALETHLG